MITIIMRMMVVMMIMIMMDVIDEISNHPFPFPFLFPCLSLFIFSVSFPKLSKVGAALASRQFCGPD